VRLTNRWNEPLAALKSTFDFMKQFSMFAPPAPASGGSLVFVGHRLPTAI